MPGLGIPIVRWNAQGARYVIGKDQNGKAGLFADTGGYWHPFDERDLEDCRFALSAEPGEVLYVSIYRLRVDEVPK